MTRLITCSHTWALTAHACVLLAQLITEWPASTTSGLATTTRNLEGLERLYLYRSAKVLDGDPNRCHAEVVLTLCRSGLPSQLNGVLRSE
jgi:hypothetical protein